jgi:hypothetical protein
MTRKFVMMAVCCAVTVAPLMPLSATASAQDVSTAVQQQWVPATQAEQQDARGGAGKDLPPKVKKAIIKKIIIKKIVCKKKGVGC